MINNTFKIQTHLLVFLPLVLSCILLDVSSVHLNLKIYQHEVIKSFYYFIDVLESLMMLRFSLLKLIVVPFLPIPPFLSVTWILFLS